MVKVLKGPIGPRTKTWKDVVLISLFWCKTCIEPSKKATGNHRRHHYSFPVEKGTAWSKCCSQRSGKKCGFPSKLCETPRLLSLLPNIGRVSCAMLWWSCFTKVFRIMSSKSSISCARIRKRSFSSCVSSMRDAWATTAVLNMFQCETPPTFLTAKIQWTEALFQQRSSQILEVATLELHWPWWPINAETQLLRVGYLRLPYLYLRAQDKRIRQHSVFRFSIHSIPDVLGNYNTVEKVKEIFIYKFQSINIDLFISDLQFHCSHPTETHQASIPRS